MKNIRSLLYTTLCLFLLTLLVSLVLSTLYFFNLFIGSLFTISKIFGFLIWIITGYLLGKNIKERTFFYALGYALFMFIICFIFIDKNLISILILISKCFLFILMALMGRNR